MNTISLPQIWNGGDVDMFLTKANVYDEPTGHYSYTFTQENSFEQYMAMPQSPKTATMLTGGNQQPWSNFQHSKKFEDIERKIEELQVVLEEEQTNAISLITYEEQLVIHNNIVAKIEKKFGSIPDSWKQEGGILRVQNQPSLNHNIAEKITTATSLEVDNASVDHESQKSSDKTTRPYKKRDQKPDDAKDYVRPTKKALIFLDEVSKIGQFASLKQFIKQIDHIFLIGSILGFKYADTQSGEIIRDSKKNSGNRTDQSYQALIFKKCTRRSTHTKIVDANPDRDAINTKIKTLADKFISDNFKADEEMKRQIKIAIQKDLISQEYKQ